MQLDLFFDNSRTILLNDATELLRTLELKKASAISTGSLRMALKTGKSFG